MINVLIGKVVAQMRHRWQILRHSGDGGYTSETVITIAVLTALALLVLGLIWTKVRAKVDSIDLDGDIPL